MCLEENVYYWNMEVNILAIFVAKVHEDVFYGYLVKPRAYRVFVINQQKVIVSLDAMLTTPSS